MKNIDKIIKEIERRIDTIHEEKCMIKTKYVKRLLEGEMTGLRIALMVIEENKGELADCISCKGKGYTIPIRHVSRIRLEKKCCECNGTGKK